MLIKATTLANAYEQILDNCLNHYEYETAPRGQKIREIIGMQIEIDNVYSNLFDNEIRSFLEREKAPEKIIEKAKYAQQKFNAGGGLWDASPNIFIHTINALQGRLFQAAVHPLEDRWYNVREYIHLMGLPHDFQLVNENYGQICQNVPVTTAADMVREAIRIIEGKCDWSKNSTSFINNTTGSTIVDNSTLFF